MEYLYHKGEKIPLIGMGTYMLGEDESRRESEAKTFAYAVGSCEMTLIDTAEMYGSGASEDFVGEMIKHTDRSKLFIVDKILPHNAQKGLYEQCCKRSLKRLGVDCIDLYLLHWRGGVELQPMVSAMQSLAEKGMIKHWGVSNFDTHDMKELFECEGGKDCFCDQVLYNISARGIEYDLLPWCKENGVLVMAYSPLCQSAADRKKVTADKRIISVSKSENKTPESLMLSFVVRNKDIITVFKTSSKEHLENNMQNVFVPITPEHLQEISKCCKEPCCKMPLQTI